jgi:hypothetical protein
MVSFQDECEGELEGLFEGEGTTCAGSPCEFGGCCTLSGDCIDDYTLSACFALPGTWNQDEVCTNLDCPPLAGACCVGTGCVANVTEAGCTLLTGNYRGNGTDCPPPGDPTIPSCGSGACCYSELGCIATSASNCSSTSGIFQGDGTRCIDLDPPCRGACCLGGSPATCFTNTIPEDCDDFPNGVWVGYPNTCSGSTCVGAFMDTGRCCLRNGDCAITTSAGCTDLVGIFTLGMDCTPNACPSTGACCREGIGCSILTAAACTADGGQYAGDNRPCTIAECEGTFIGACCFPNGNCNNISATGCGQLGGVFQGADTVCSEIECTVITGACCTAATGGCMEQLESDCDDPGETYMGDHSSCLPNPCPQPATGACCIIATGDCQIRTMFQCGSQGGTYQGDNTDCERADCPLPQAACCIDGGVCVTANPAECASLDGMYQGPMVQCTANPCAAPIAIVSSSPVNGAIDARQHSSLSGNCIDAPGFNIIGLGFDGPTAALTAADFNVTIEPAGMMAPTIIGVAPNGMNATVMLSSAIPVGRWTRITHIQSGTSTRIGFLPGDVSNDGTIDRLNGVCPPCNYAEYQTDINRSGTTEPSDVLRVIDLLNGAGCYDPYLGVSLPP